MMFYLVVLPLELSLTAANLYPGLNDYGLLKSHVWKYPHHHHQPSALFYKGVPISENAYGYYPPLWNVHSVRPYVPNWKLPKFDYEKALQNQEDTRDIRSQGRFCQFFDESGGNHKQYTGNLRPRSFFPENEETTRKGRVKVTEELSSEEVDNRRHHLDNSRDSRSKPADEEDEDFRIGRVNKEKDIPVGKKQDGIQNLPFRPRTSEDVGSSVPRSP